MLKKGDSHLFLRPIVRGSRFSRRGLLLIEAIIASIVLTVGLVGITVGLSNQLKAIRVVEDQNTLLMLARTKLNELEAGLISNQIPEDIGPEDFAEPYEDFSWQVDIGTIDAEQVFGMDVSVVHIRVQGEKSSLTVDAYWPTEFIVDWIS